MTPLPALILDIGYWEGGGVTPARFWGCVGYAYFLWFMSEKYVAYVKSTYSNFRAYPADDKFSLGYARAYAPKQPCVRPLLGVLIRKKSMVFASMQKSISLFGSILASFRTNEFFFLRDCALVLVWAYKLETRDWNLCWGIGNWYHDKPFVISHSVANHFTRP